MPLDRAKFVKVMRMTESTVDAEALSAIRMANKMLAEAKVGWGGLISGVSVGSAVKVSKDGPAPPWARPAPTKNISEALEYLVDREEDEWLPLQREWIRRKQMSPYDQRRVYERLYQLERAEDNARDIPEA